MLVAAGNPELRILAEAPKTKVFGVLAPVATLEHLLLMYLYSDQPKHLADLATIVRSGKADLSRIEGTLAEIHPEAIPDWRRKVATARAPVVAPPRPGRRRR